MIALQWNPLALFGLAILIVAGGLSWLVYMAAPRRTTNRRVAIFLLLYAILFGARYGLRPLVVDQDAAYATYAVYMVVFLAGAPLYLWVIATLDTPITRPLKLKPVQVVLVALAVLAPIAWFARPEMFIVRSFPSGHGLFGRWAFEEGAWYDALLYYGYLPLFAYTALAAIDAWRRAPNGSTTRGRAGGFAVAFATHDVLFATQFVLIISTSTRPQWLDWVITFANVVIPLVFVTLLAYAVLRWSLFDIDLRIKRGISKGTLLAVFLVVFIGVAEAAQNWLSDEYGYLVGGLAAIVLLLAVNPLQRLAARVADTAMPNVTASPEYLSYRKLQVYRATLEGALEDGTITPKERAMLDALARELGIQDQDRRAVEQDALAVSTTGKG